MMTIFSSCASLPSDSVEGPGISSANAKRSAFSSRQKYWERKSSWRQTISAPLAAASRIFHSALAKFSLGSTAQLICTRPMWNFWSSMNFYCRKLGLRCAEESQAEPPAPPRKEQLGSWVGQACQLMDGYSHFVT